jgi:hypothetical protein
MINMFNEQKTLFLGEHQLPKNDEILSSNIFYNLVKKLPDEIQKQYLNNLLNEDPCSNERINSPDANYPSKPCLKNRSISRVITYPKWCLIGGFKKANQIQANEKNIAYESMKEDYVKHVSEFHVELLKWKFGWRAEHDRLNKKKKKKKKFLLKKILPY